MAGVKASIVHLLLASVGLNCLRETVCESHAGPYETACACYDGGMQMQLCNTDVVALVRVNRRELYVEYPNGDVEVIPEGETSLYPIQGRYAVETWQIYIGENMVENYDIGYVYTDVDSGSCGVTMDSEAYYIVFGAMTEDKLWTSSCSLTSKMEDIQDEVLDAIQDFHDYPGSCSCELERCVSAACGDTSTGSWCQSSVASCYTFASYCVMEENSRCTWRENDLTANCQPPSV